MSFKGKKITPTEVRKSLPPLRFVSDSKGKDNFENYNKKTKKPCYVLFKSLQQGFKGITTP